jgi:hypothetical protein
VFAATTVADRHLRRALAHFAGADSDGRLIP